MQRLGKYEQANGRRRVGESSYVCCLLSVSCLLTAIYVFLVIFLLMNCFHRLVTDPHSPGHLRVNGPLKNLPEFHAAFGIDSGYAMYAPDDERVEIW